MNRYIIVAIIAAISLGAGGYFFFNSQKNTTSTSQGHNMDMSGKPVAQSHRSYELEVTTSTDNVQPNQPVNFSYKVKNDQGAILKNYQTVYEKIMHFIVVRKDLQKFQHIHPDFNQQSGEFTVSITFPTDGSYRIFPDFTPGDENPQNLPVTVYKDITVGDISKYSPQQVAVDTNPKKTFDGYNITFSTNPEPKAQTNFTYTVKIEQNGQPVTNLENYLGALGHTVILKEGTLDFIHTHAGETGMGPKIEFSTTFPHSGIYKIFTQFQHQNKVITTDYVIEAK